MKKPLQRTLKTAIPDEILEAKTVSRTLVVLEGRKWRWIESKDFYGPAKDLSTKYELVGRLPPDQLDATEWKDEYKLPEGYDPGEHDLWWTTTCNKPRWIWRLPGDYIENPGWKLVQKAARDQGLSATQKHLLERHSRWASQLQAFCKKHAPDGVGRDVCDVALEIAEKAEVLVKKIKTAFYAATGQEYEPGVNYYDPYSYSRDRNALARLRKMFVWKSKTPKEPCPMSLFTKALKAIPKYAVLFALFSVLSSPMTYWKSATEWWNSPTQLEFGDWTKVTSCDACDHVGNFESGMCPNCGGEAFSTRKAQVLQEYEKPFWKWQPVSGVRGYVFEDGSVSLSPGHWKVPEREVRS